MSGVRQVQSRPIAWCGRAIGLILCVRAACAQTTTALHEALDAVPTTASLRELHTMMCAEPHPAGTDADQRLIDELASRLQSYGLQVLRHDIYPLLAQPVSAEVTVHHDGQEIDLPVREPTLEGDAYSGHEALTIGWNAYSGSGSATGQVVYANYGTKDDFERLAKLGIDLTGRVVLARYGGNFRGYKATFAEAAGAAALLIYTDPADSGYARGPAWPDGGWAHGGSIQNGSIKTLAYPGDALTPGVEATADAVRLDVGDVAMPTIPVQPIGWDAAQQIMQRMAGDPLPVELRRSWQGGLPLAYRLTGGPKLTVTVSVQQQRAVKRTTNVLGVIEGATHPDQAVIVGCHFDAWTFGAGDPHAGSIVLMEMARSFGAAAQQGRRPARTVIFANWAAEEFGIIGSTEWVEANRENLLQHAVAYINLDMAAMGMNFRCSSAPSLKRVIAEAAATVPHPSDAHDTVLAQWGGDADSEPRYGTLGGGSDHVGFYCHVGVPSCGLGAGGSDGVSYHSNSDNLAWYRQVVGDDYESARMLTRIGNALVARLADADIVPLDPLRYAPDTRSHLDALAAAAEQTGVLFDDASLRQAIDSYEATAQRTMQAVHDAAQRGTLDDAALEAINDELIQLERCWLRDSGLVGRPWYRSLYAATDPHSGYGAWILPGIQAAVEAGDARRVKAELDACEAVFENLSERMGVIGALTATDP